MPPVVAFAVLGVSVEAQSLREGEVVINNLTGPSHGEGDANDSPITFRVGCDDEEADLAAGSNLGCRGARVSLTPVGEVVSSVRLRLVSGSYLEPATGAFTEGTVTLETSPNNPACDPRYNDRNSDDVVIGGHTDDRDFTDNQVLEGGLEYVTVRHRCQ